MIFGWMIRVISVRRINRRGKAMTQSSPSRDRLLTLTRKLCPKCTVHTIPEANGIECSTSNNNGCHIRTVQDQVHEETLMLRVKAHNKTKLSPCWALISTEHTISFTDAQSDNRTLTGKQSKNPEKSGFMLRQKRNEWYWWKNVFRSLGELICHKDTRRYDTSN